MQAVYAHVCTDYLCHNFCRKEQLIHVFRVNQQINVVTEDQHQPGSLCTCVHRLPLPCRQSMHMCAQTPSVTTLTSMFSQAALPKNHSTAGTAQSFLYSTLLIPYSCGFAMFLYELPFQGLKCIVNASSALQVPGSEQQTLCAPVWHYNGHKHTAMGLYCSTCVCVCVCMSVLQC